MIRSMQNNQAQLSCIDALWETLTSTPEKFARVQSNEKRCPSCLIHRTSMEKLDPLD